MDFVKALVTLVVCVALIQSAGQKITKVNVRVYPDTLAIRSNSVLRFTLNVNLTQTVEVAMFALKKHAKVYQL